MFVADHEMMFTAWMSDALLKWHVTLCPSNMHVRSHPVRWMLRDIVIGGVNQMCRVHEVPSTT
jgi:hypothetical protein